MKLLLLLGCILCILLFYLGHILRQIRDICRQLHFLKTHDSNMRITTDTQSGYLGTLVNDLNDLLEQCRAEHKKYMKKEKILSDTYTNLSHDIRTPLTSLDGYIQLLSDCSEPDEQNYYLSIITERVASLKDMLEELFTFTRLKDDSFELKLTECDLTRILKTTLFSYYDEWLKRDITPSFELPENPVLITGNDTALRRIIQNILKNGIDHGESRLNISLSLSESAEPDSATAILHFENEVKEAHMIDTSQVFERFYKADAARSQTSSGLGLSIAKEMVLRMNGSIHASTKDNTFCIEIRFPVQSQPPQVF